MHRITENGFFFSLDMLRGALKRMKMERKMKRTGGQGQAPIKSDQNMIIQGAAHTVCGQAIQCKKKM
jgi:hypothetical protein